MIPPNPPKEPAWIEADPVSKRVEVLPPEGKTSYALKTPVKILRFRALFPAPQA